MASNGDQSSILEGGNNRHACAACKHQRRKCDPSCPLAPHFPANRKEEFQSVHDIFGVGNVKKLLDPLGSQHDREAAVKSIKWKAAYWKQHPVQGPLGYIEKLEEDNKRLRLELQSRPPPMIAVKIGEQDNNNTSMASSDARQEESHEFNYNYGDISNIDLDQVESSVMAQDNSGHRLFGNEHYRFVHEDYSNNPCFSGNNHPRNNIIYPQFGPTNHGGDVYDRASNDVMVDNAMASRVFNGHAMEGRVDTGSRVRVGDVIPDPPCYLLPLPQQNLDFLPDAGDHWTSSVSNGQVLEGRVVAHIENVRVGDVIRGPQRYFLPLPQQNSDILPVVGDHRARSLDNIQKNDNEEIFPSRRVTDPNSQTTRFN